MTMKGGANGIPLMSPTKARLGWHQWFAIQYSCHDEHFFTSIAVSPCHRIMFFIAAHMNRGFEVLIRGDFAIKKAVFLQFPQRLLAV